MLAARDVTAHGMQLLALAIHHMGFWIIQKLSDHHFGAADQTYPFAAMSV